MQKAPMTVEGEIALREELHHLIKEVRPTIIEAIATAREHGDLKENAEYHAAREQQSFTEGRIQDIEGKLSNIQVIDINKIPHGDRVVFGTTVTIINLDLDKTVTYKIVGDDEADVKACKISYQSPIARALMGKEISEVVVVKAPSGDVEYEIDNVEFI
ncbi:transcription elongation factor GreA [marine gamma proteobacterium HTCC2207]|jgi:transcription elongation factor GreA|uniref:Transcription elongation factor GreA n=1 Tax=gamma proteobacterium HTCC2207 TaxID=314287 RepID=Q1YSX0_9GAMM|nr:transcription elongation factor GreA [marine gamma proteobacterium HTCC2207] [gamma proteobacterium HTCC2207]MBT5105024.1 transcription elongation factor GreA [Porticoccaceae bacterium]MDC3261398.1 transcription elongation factor GreA [bacterium]MDB4428426.1 transcription elongation factor GreA [Porticoccaceae bacterium]MDB9706642.1 transcription elongation factor GreA [Porticoccaceae bacterium]